jgi:CRP/FNR family transcriptional regulator
MEEKKNLIKKTFEGVFSDDLVNALAQNGTILNVYEGQHIISRGDIIKNIPIILEGTSKIVRTEPSGEEHILFYLKDGEACTAAFSICNNEKQSEVDYIAETNSKVLMFPIRLMDVLTNNYPDWRYYVCKNYNRRMKEFLRTLDEIAFKKMDQRIYNYLKEKASVLDSNELHITHQEIANDLATSRVVVSRLLKQMEKDGLLKLHRNKIILS